MAIPKYDEMYRVFLDCLSDMKPHGSKEVRDAIAARLSVSEAERQELLPSGRQAIFDNRVAWTRTYLKKAGLLTAPSRGTYQLTQLGKQVLDSNPAVIDNSFLDQFDSFHQFKHAESAPVNHASTDSQSGQTPQDAFDLAYQQINHALADDLLTEIMNQSPAFFEKLVVQLLENMGYGGSVENAGVVVGQTGDEGIDGIIREDKLGFSLIYIQAKRWDRTTSIGRPEIQKFVGALAGQGANKGLFITTAQFTKEAREYVKKQHTTKVVLVDGESLAKLMIEYDLGVSTQAVYQIKRMDKRLNFLQELLRRHTLLGQQPPLHGADHRVCEKVHGKLVQLLLSKESGNAFRQERLDILPEVVTERILSFDLQGLPVKSVILVKILANFLDKGPALLIVGVAHIQLLVFQQGNKLGIKNPIHKVIFVLKVIVETFAVHITPLTDLRHIDLVKGLLRHQLLQRSR